MRSLRFSLFLLVSHLTLFYNIERLDIGANNAVNIESFVYGIAFLAIASVILVKTIWKHHVSNGLILWLGIYGVIKAIRFIQGNTEIGGVYNYIIIAEIAMLVLSILLAYNLSVQFHDVEETLLNITFLGANNELKKLEDSESEIQKEIYRSRRFGHSLSLFIIDIGEDPNSPQVNKIIDEFQKTIKNHYVIVSISRIISNMLRRTDILFERRGKGNFILLSPETDEEGANLLSDRIKEVVLTQLGIGVKVGKVSFPEDALTFDDLMEKAEELLD